MLEKKQIKSKKKKKKLKDDFSEELFQFCWLFISATKIFTISLTLQYSIHKFDLKHE